MRIRIHGFTLKCFSQICHFPEALMKRWSWMEVFESLFFSWGWPDSLRLVTPLMKNTSENKGSPWHEGPGAALEGLWGGRGRINESWKTGWEDERGINEEVWGRHALMVLERKLWGFWVGTHPPSEAQREGVKAPPPLCSYHNSGLKSQLEQQSHADLSLQTFSFCWRSCRQTRPISSLWLFSAHSEDFLLYWFL